MNLSGTVCLATVQESIPTLALRCETWQRLVQVTAWILKWSHLHGEPKKGKLSAEELKESEFTWLRNRQKVVFLLEIEELCNKGQVNQKSHIVKLDLQFDQTKRLLVVGGRVQFAQIPEEAKHQMIMCSSSPIVEQCDDSTFSAGLWSNGNRHGMARVIHSDNQTTFHKAAKVFKALT